MSCNLQDTDNVQTEHFRQIVSVQLLHKSENMNKFSVFDMVQA